MDVKIPKEEETMSAWRPSRMRMDSPQGYTPAVLTEHIPKLVAFNWFDQCKQPRPAVNHGH